uniref:Cadherin domain-containing protein n=1 Tax=Angiostrongylus cantonensis TaxID=6313 RepID=A0A0K0DG76_ANGCA
METDPNSRNPVNSSKLRSTFYPEYQLRLLCQLDQESSAIAAQTFSIVEESNWENINFIRQCSDSGGKYVDAEKHDRVVLNVQAELLNGATNQTQAAVLIQDRNDNSSKYQRIL